MTIVHDVKYSIRVAAVVSLEACLSVGRYRALFPGLCVYFVINKSLLGWLNIKKTHPFLATNASKPVSTVGARSTFTALYSPPQHSSAPQAPTCLKHPILTRCAAFLF
jgi:hypothetical protein